MAYGGGGQPMDTGAVNQDWRIKEKMVKEKEKESKSERKEAQETVAMTKGMERKVRKEKEKTTKQKVR